MKKKIVIMALGFLMIGSGWAIRSTMLIDNYVNKPIGGALITIGVVVFVLSVFWLFKKPPKDLNL
jgi:hypothetical protein